MTFTDNGLLFLATVAAISTTGAMMPGPVIAAAMVKGLKSRWSGFQVALGHMVIELPTIILIYLGLSTVLKDQRVSIAIGILGGALLLYMGASMLMSKRSESDKDGKSKGKTKDPFPYPPLLAGIITTATNPYYFVWWATLGAALILNAVVLGLVFLVLMTIVHWSIDLGWTGFVSFAVNKSKDLGKGRAYLIVFALCGIMMLAFGAWFIVSALKTALNF